MNKGQADQQDVQKIIRAIQAKVIKRQVGQSEVREVDLADVSLQVSTMRDVSWNMNYLNQNYDITSFPRKTLTQYLMWPFRWIMHRIIFPHFILRQRQLNASTVSVLNRLVRAIDEKSSRDLELGKRWKAYEERQRSFDRTIEDGLTQLSQELVHIGERFEEFSRMLESLETRQAEHAEKHREMRLEWDDRFREVLSRQVELGERWEAQEEEQRSLSGELVRVGERFEKLGGMLESLETRQAEHVEEQREMRRDVLSQQAELGKRWEAQEEQQRSFRTSVTEARERDRGRGLGVDCLAFEERFRGAEANIRARQASYAELFRNREVVLDLGCGRGEFLEICREADIHAIGVDYTEDMVRLCRTKGLTVHQNDAISYLRSLPDESVDGIFSAQLIEHLTPGELTDLIALAFEKMRPKGLFLAETINPLSLTWMKSFHQDLSHVRVLCPYTMLFLLEQAGFKPIELRYLSPCPEERKLVTLPNGPDLADVLNAQVQVLNGNFQKLNELLYGPQDYAVLAEK